MTTILILATILITTLVLVPIFNVDVMLSPVIGLMAGVLYSYTDYDNGREHTVQIFLFLIGITIIWDTPSNG